MADDLKFGPEWLRALTDSNNVTSPPPSPGFGPKYKLAEHRYGREEMLALFVPKSSLPERLKAFPVVCVEKAQHPLAFAGLSEEEQRLMAQGVNSSAVLRMMGRGGSSLSRGGGRGGGERGRGRGRGRGDGLYREYEEGGFGRGRPHRSESWDDRGGDKRFTGFTRPFPEENSIVPRKEFSRSMSSENWRDPPKREPEEEDDGSWRKAGPKDRSVASRGNWRERTAEKDYERSKFDERYERGYGNRNRYKSGGSHDDEEDLPEWSMADNEGDIGTFDASGEFMSVKELEKRHRSKDDSDPVTKKKNNTEVGDRSDKKLKPVKEKSPESEDQQEVNEKAKVSKPVPNKSNTTTSKQDTHKEVVKTSSSNKVSGGSAGVGGADTTKSQGAPPPEGTAIKAGKASKLGNKEDIHNSASSSVTADSSRTVSQEAGSPASKSGKDKGSSGTKTKDKPTKDNSNLSSKKKNSKVCDNSSMQEKPVECVPKTAINTTSALKTPKVTQLVEEPMQKQEEEADFGHLEQVAESLVADMTDEEDEVVVGGEVGKQEEVPLPGGSSLPLPLDHKNSQKWFYRDPQGEVQGPFSASEMSEWFSAGYFTMNLMVTRGCDENFHTLGDLIKKWGRVPFLPGNTPPPLRSSPVTVSQSQASAISQSVTVTMSSAPAPQTSSPSDPQLAAASQQQAEQLKAFLVQQQYMQQQAAALRQLQMQQLIQSLQQNEAWTKLPPQQQQQLALQLMLKQQQAAALQHSMSNNPQTTTTVTQSQAEGAAPQPPEVNIQQLHNNTPKQQLQGMPEKHEDASASIWNALSNPPVSGSSWSQPASVWDIEQSGKAKSLEEIEREELARAQQEKEKKEAEARKKNEEECCRQQREMEKQKELEKQEAERKREQERQVELEKQRREKQQREEAEKRRREQEEEQLQRAAELHRQAEEQRRQVEEHRRRTEEMQRLAEEEKKQKEAEKRAEEMRRRQEKAEEARRQQQKEALYRLQQEQLANMQLPQHAQWATTNTSSQNTTGLTLQQIQQLEAEKERRELAEREKLQEVQRKQMEALAQEKATSSQSWAHRSQATLQGQNQQKKTLIEIQQEQAKQHLADLKSKQSKQASVPLATAAAWSNPGVNPANWAQEGAWGNNRGVAGFWEEPARPKPTKSGKVNNSHFPALNPQVANVQAQSKQKQQAKSKKDEEAVQRVFQAAKPKNDFTEWCEMALSGMPTSVDIPTFVGFLMDVDSPYEVHDYVRSYLGESKESIEFGKRFIEKRSVYRSQIKNQTQQKEEAMWGPAPAINPGRGGAIDTMATNNNFEMVAANGKTRKKTKKMQRVDSSILGFTCSAATERVNVGEIENM